MIKEALQYIVDLKAPSFSTFRGVDFSDKQLYEIHEKEHFPDALEVSTLASIVTYLKSNPDKLTVGPAMIHVRSYNEVALILPLTDRTKERAVHMVAKNNVKQFKFGSPMDRETFNVALQTQFVRTDNSSALLQLIGTMQEENGVQQQDDGISQKVTAKTGVASLSNVVIPNPLELVPFRTFAEVMQPESLFVFRIHERMNCALYEADGERWKVDCIHHIKAWFTFELAELLSTGTVVLLG